MEHDKSLAALNARISEQSANLTELSDALNKSQQVQSELKSEIGERDSIIANFPKRLEKIASENEKKISEEVERRLQPYVEAKSLADSMKFENEEKAKQNKILREQNNRIILENEQFREEIDKLSKFKHIAEDRSEMVRTVLKSLFSNFFLDPEHKNSQPSPNNRSRSNSTTTVRSRGGKESVELLARRGEIPRRNWPPPAFHQFYFQP